MSNTTFDGRRARRLRITATGCGAVVAIAASSLVFAPGASASINLGPVTLPGVTVPAGGVTTGVVPVVTTVVPTLTGTGTGSGTGIPVVTPVLTGVGSVLTGTGTGSGGVAPVLTGGSGSTGLGGLVTVGGSGSGSLVDVGSNGGTGVSVDVGSGLATVGLGQGANGTGGTATVTVGAGTGGSTGSTGSGGGGVTVGVGVGSGGSTGTVAVGDGGSMGSVAVDGGSGSGTAVPVPATSASPSPETSASPAPAAGVPSVALPAAPRVAPVLKTLKLSAPFKTVYPKRDGYRDTVSFAVRSATSTGKAIAVTGSAVLKKGTAKVKSWKLKSSTQTLVWNGLNGKKLKPGKYVIAAAMKTASGKVMKASTTVQVSRKKLVRRAASIVTSLTDRTVSNRMPAAVRRSYAVSKKVTVQMVTTVTKLDGPARLGLKNGKKLAYVPLAFGVTTSPDIPVPNTKAYRIVRISHDWDTKKVTLKSILVIWRYMVLK